MSPSPSPSPPSLSPHPHRQPPSSPPTAIPIKKPQPIPWSHEETLNLIHAYQEKWYSLKRGQLKASQWEEVAVTVAARCRLDDAAAKSATQCRHKIEKLRKRYRAEKLKPLPNSWAYFSLMEDLERGPLPISAVAPSTAFSDGSDDNDFPSILGRGFPRRFDGYFQKVEFSNGYPGNLRKVERESEDDKDLMEELAVEIRDFAERFVRVEKKKMEMMRETERMKMEMENKRMEMILVSQQKTVDMISKVFGLSQKKMKMTQDL